MKYIFAIALLVVFAVFAFSVNHQNPGLITLHYYFNIEWTVRLVTLLLCTFLIGLFLGGFIVSISLFGQKLKTGRVQRKLKKVEKEVEGLRAVSPEPSES